MNQGLKLQIKTVELKKNLKWSRNNEEKCFHMSSLLCDYESDCIVKNFVINTLVWFKESN